jgi:hypothetical protein
MATLQKEFAPFCASQKQLSNLNKLLAWCDAGANQKIVFFLNSMLLFFDKLNEQLYKLVI